MLDQLVALHVLRKWPVDLLRVVEQYSTAFTFYVLGKYSIIDGLKEQIIYEWKDDDLHRLTVVPTPRDTASVVKVDHCLYILPAGDCLDVVDGEIHSDVVVDMFDLHTHTWHVMPPVPRRFY